MLSVLIVDDEAYVCDGIAQNIPWSQFGIGSVLKARTGKEGLAVAEKMRPDIVISDVRMPHMNGLDMASTLLSIHPKIRFIFMSAYSELEYYKKALKLHAVSFIEKPIILEELTEEVRHAADQIESEASAGFVSKADIEKYALLDLIRQNKTPAAERLGDELTAFSFHALFVIGRLPELPQQTIEQARKKILSLLPSPAKILGIYDGQFHLFLASSSPFSPEQIRTAGEYLLRLSEGRAAYITTAGCRSAEQLSEIYKQAVQRQAYGFFHDIAHLDLSFSSSSAPKKSFPDVERLCKLIKEAIKDADFGRHQKLTDAFFSQLRTTPYLPPDQTCLSVLKMLNAVKEGFQSLGAPTNDEPPWEAVTRMTSLTQIQKYYNEQTALMIGRFEALHEKGRNALYIRQMIDQNFMIPHFSVSSLSDKVHFSESYLSNLFKKQYHMTVGEYINQLRMEKAKQLLLEPAARVSDVAEQVGFDNTDYFTKRFRQFTGLTPTEYRR
ncbi:helix-turn-helix domain-containing protein [Beduinella massiliensis]|uniref:helix-turn-helix domain-containing protein n=1 Tax=Beduinella massiliensis TaxID=1852363 RepID=UPI000C8278BA